METLIKVILLVLLSSVKFVFAPSFAAFYQPDVNLAYWQACLGCIIGGMTGVFVFANFADTIINFINGIVHKVFNIKPKPKKIFTKRNRIIVKVWRKYGLLGIAVLTPVLFSIPVGTVLACYFERKRYKVYLYLFTSVIIWALLLNSVYYLSY